MMVRKETLWRAGIERCQSRVEAEPRRAIGTEDRVRLAHILDVSYSAQSAPWNARSFVTSSVTVKRSQ